MDEIWKLRYISIINDVHVYNNIKYTIFIITVGVYTILVVIIRIITIWGQISTVSGS